MKKPDLVFLWVGDRLPDYFGDTLEIAKKYSNANLVLLCSQQAHLNRKIDSAVTIYEVEQFYLRDERLYGLEYFGPLNFRNEFWLKTLERYLILLAFMRFYKKDILFHAELDNAIFDISKLGDRLDGLGKGIFAPQDSAERAIPGLIYINSVQALGDLCESIFVVSGQKNDMYLLGRFLQTSSHGYCLPTESVLSEEVSWSTLSRADVGGIFDACEMGQYLLGVDPRNSPRKLFVKNRFLNENLLLDFKKCNFILNENQGMYLDCKNERIRLFNLHIHSKNMRILLNPKKFNKVLYRLRLGKRTLFFGWHLRWLDSQLRNLLKLLAN